MHTGARQGLTGMTRYAIYYTAPAGPLADFGAAWLGWDVATGTEPVPVVLDGLPIPRETITETPRKYGLHATIKAPFRLAEGADIASLHQAFDAFCARHKPATCPALAATPLGRFLALIPDGSSREIDALAGAAVTELDHLRAPLSEADRARRMKSKLSPRHVELLDAWGYPHVLDAFRFHITLTGRLPEEAVDATRAILANAMHPLLPQPFVIDALSLCVEAENGRFRTLQRTALTG